ncbi:MAG: aminotransferase class IV [Alicyclobacillus herbarius]|uniref:aminotransferase class IV n=1 Tax=Alicyclobacillus herbarius TaxID=122960 RepID=UPI0003FAF4FC|nr:aminotransferase class IV [Alicyclobacillus herbarius]MCL6631535.1 aminotransferase class IV [Alicyclobacillus herbarius]
MSEVYYYNGQFVESVDRQVALEDRGHQFGDGIYEVVRVYGGRPFLLEWHLERFERSCAAIGLSNPLSREQWVEIIHDAIRRSNEAEAQVYWQVTRGAAPRTHWFPATNPSVTLIVRPYRGTAPMEEPALFAVPDERWANVYVKTINLLPNVLAKEAAHRIGAAEALLVRNGTITEGSGSNAWFVAGGQLYTHPANRHILPGITRRFIVQLAASLSIPVQERPVSLTDLTDVDEVFMTGTTTEIMPVQKIITSEGLRSELVSPADEPRPSLIYACEQPVLLWSRQRPSVVTKRLQEAFAEAVHQCRLGCMEIF